MRRVFLALNLLVCCWAAHGEGNRESKLSVFNFGMKAGGKEWQWLEKGIADRLITDISQSGKAQPVQRDTMQALAEQIHWAPELMSEPGRLQMLTEAASIATVISGVYEVDRGDIRISASAVDVKKQVEVTRFVVEGKVEDIPTVVRKLSADVLKWIAGGDVKTVATELPAWTKSLDAAKALYEGMDLCDRGKYHEAWLSFRRASTSDKDYAEARYWMGRTYCLMFRYRHAMLELRAFIEQYPNHPRAGDAIKDYVYCWEYLDAPADQLFDVYTDLKKRCPDALMHKELNAWYVPASVWLGCKIALLEYNRGRFKEAIEAAQGALEQCVNPWAQNVIRGVLHSAACRQRELTGSVPENALVFGVRSAVRGEFLTESRKVHLSSSGETGRLIEKTPMQGTPWIQVPYSVFAPTGFVITGLECRLLGGGESGVVHAYLSREKDGDIGVVSKESSLASKEGFNFSPLARTTGVELLLSIQGKDWSTDHRWRYEGATFKAQVEPMGPIGAVDVRCRSMADFAVSVDGIPCRVGDGVVGMLKPGEHIVSVEPVARNSPMKVWSTNIVIRVGGVEKIECDLQWKKETKWDGWIGMSDRAETGLVAQLQTTWDNRPAVLAEDDGVRVVWVYNADLWCSTSRDGVTFGGAKRLVSPVSTGSQESNPVLTKDHRNRYILSFLSRRTPSSEATAYVCWSRDFSSWSEPIPVARHKLWGHAMAIDRNGQYVVACLPQLWGRQVHIVVSNDAYRWKYATRIDSTLPVANMILSQPANSPLTLRLWSRQDGKSPARDIVIKRYESMDGVTWSCPANDNPKKLGFPSGSFGVTEVGQNTVIGTFENRTWGGGNMVSVTHASARIFRIDVGGWKEVLALPGVTSQYGTVSYHPKWGFMMTWVSAPRHKDTGWITDDRMESSGFLEGALYMIRRVEPLW